METITIELSTIEPAIKLTHELEKDNSLPFLDILVNKNDELELISSAISLTTAKK